MLMDWLKKKSIWLLVLLPLLFYGLFYFFPLFSIFQISFSAFEKIDFATILNSLRSARVGRTFGFTLWQALLSTLLTLLVGMPGAYLFSHFDFRGKKAMRVLTTLPFILPTLVVATAYNSMWGETSWLNLGLMRWFGFSEAPLQILGTFSAILIAHTFYNTAIVIQTVGDFWEKLSPKLNFAAETLGASKWKTFVRISLPLLMPAILSAVLLIFLFDFSSFGVVLILGGPKFSTLETEIYYQTISLFNLPVAAILAMLQLVFVLGLIFLQNKITNKLQLTLDVTKVENNLRKPKTMRMKLLIWGVMIFYFLFFAVPLLSLISQSFLSNSNGFTLQFYRTLFNGANNSMFYASPAKAILISLGYAGMTAVIALGLGLCLAWANLQFGGKHFWEWVEPVFLLPLGTSAVTLGFGFLIALDQPPLDLRSSPFLIPLAHSLVALPFVLRILTPALARIKPALRQSAAVLGANSKKVFFRIDLPIISQSLLAAGIFSFLISLGEFGASAMIARPEFPTIPVMIYRYLGRPGELNFGQSLALSTLLLLTTIIGMSLIEKIQKRLFGDF